MKTIHTFIKIAIASLFCIITMTSCSELSLSETELKFPAGFFETKSFVVKTDLNWDIVEQPDWVKTDKIEENGRTIVEVMPKVNNSFDSRKGEIKIQTSEKHTHVHTQTLWEHLVVDNVKKQILFSFHNLIYVFCNTK